MINSYIFLFCSFLSFIEEGSEVTLLYILFVCFQDITSGVTFVTVDFGFYYYGIQYITKAIFVYLFGLLFKYNGNRTIQ